jgi:PiT family inorganic phosphate transporter
MFRLDELTRYGLILVGAFGAFSLGANNIANVVGVFLPVSPFTDIKLFGGINFSPAQQLFLLGSLAISLGVITYSKRVMDTVGSGIFKLSPVMALVAVWAHSVVLFLFASQRLETLLISLGLPSLPLVPVSSSQAIVGAVIGMGLLKGRHNIRWKTVGGIAGSWITTPIFACLVSFILLFVLQNVFQQTVYCDPGIAEVTTGIESTLHASK